MLAAGSEWMKAFVVNDIRSMIMITTYAQGAKTTRLKIIPLDVVNSSKEKPDMPHDDVNVIGRLSNFYTV